MHIMKYFDNSILQTYNECATKCYWRYILGLVPIESIAVALEFGSGIHLAFEYLYKKAIKGEVTKEDCAEAVKIFRIYFLQWDGIDSKRIAQLGEDIIKDYYKLYFPEYFKVLMVEKNILIPLTDNVTYSGRIDLVAEMDNGPYVIDHKATTMPNAIVPKPNHQFTGYVFATVKKYGLEIKGAMANIVGIFKSKREFLRPTTRRTEQDINTWKCWFISTAKKIQLALEATETIDCDPTIWFSQEPRSCYNFFRICPYIDLCNCNDRCMRERLIEGLFKVNKWEPWVTK